MPYVRIWVHLIWGTKWREKIITKGLKPKLMGHIRENAMAKNIYVDFMNMVEDHTHLLVSLGASQSISKIAGLLKRESSHWVNKKQLTGGRFEWQDDYIALSVSEREVDRVREYIKNQEEHHRKKSFAEEYEHFLEKLGFKE